MGALVHVSACEVSALLGTVACACIGAHALHAGAETP